MTEDQKSTSPALASTQLGMIAALALVVAIVGGWLCGWLMVRYGIVGALSLSLIGFSAGVSSRAILGRGNPKAAGLLIGGLVFAMVWALVYWLKMAEFNFGGANTWPESVGKLFTLPVAMPQHFFATLFCLAVGAYSVWTQAGSRWRTVRVREP